MSAARAYRLLSLFPGPGSVSAECAAALLGEGAARTAELLSMLLDEHLIEQQSPERYLLHSPEYDPAPAQARESDEERSEALIRLVRWYVCSAQDAGRAVETLRGAVRGEPTEPAEPTPQDGRLAAAAWFDAEQPNLLMVAHGAVWLGLDEEAWHLAAAIEPLHALAGTVPDWLAITQVALGAAGRASDRTGYARVQMTRASALMLARRNQEAVGALHSALAAFEQTRDVQGMIDAENRLGLIHRAERELDAAEACFRHVALRAELAGLSLWHAQALENLADTTETGGAHAKARNYAERALAEFTAAGSHPSMTVGPLLILARAARETRQLASAAQHTARAEAALGEGPAVSRWLTYAVAFEQAAQARAAGHTRQAHEAYLQCAKLAEQLRDHPRAIRARTAIADTLIILGQPREAAELARTAAGLAREHATPYDTATALHVLASALTSNGHADEAVDTRREAARLLETYTDPAASRLHAELFTGPGTCSDERRASDEAHFPAFAMPECPAEPTKQEMKTLTQLLAPLVTGQTVTRIERPPLATGGSACPPGHAAPCPGQPEPAKWGRK